MKKTLLIALLGMIMIKGYAQNKLYIFAGPQISTAGYSIHGHEQDHQFKPGFQLGTGIKIPFEGRLYFSPSAYYSLKGYKVDFDRPASIPDTAALNNNTTIHTFEVAATLQFDLGKGDNHWYVKLGPSLDFQLVGKESFTKNDGSKIKRDMKFGFNDYGHYGANIIAIIGYELKNDFFFFAQYTHGIGSIDNLDYGPGITHRVVGLSVGKFIHTTKH